MLPHGRRRAVRGWMFEEPCDTWFLVRRTKGRTRRRKRMEAGKPQDRKRKRRKPGGLMGL